MSRFILAAILAVILLSGCNAAMMNGFARGIQGYPPPPQPQIQYQRTQPRYTTGNIYTPQGTVMYDSTSY